MGALKQYLWEELTEDEWYEPDEAEWDRDNDFWDIYDDYINKRLEGLPLEEIEEVKSYLNRHYWDLVIFTDQMSAPDGDWQELCEEDWCKRDFLMHEMREKEDNKNIDTLRNGIFNYIKENHMDMFFPDR